MRGETKICLFDAKTGKQVYEHTDHNMVTNAVSKLLSPKNEWLYGTISNNLLGRLGGLFPLSTRAFGGVLLFDGTIDEDVDTILPPANVSNVGYAGGEYAGANVFKGSYNTNESGPITGGYRHVWDFGTDKGNGTIQSVCLTSLMGGNSGLNVPASGDTSEGAIVGLDNFVTGASPWTVKKVQGRPLFVKAAPDTGRCEYITTYNGILYKVTESNLNDLKLSDILNANPSSDVVRYTYEKLVDLKAPSHAYSYPNTRVYYMDGKIHHVYSTDGAPTSFSITHNVYSLEGVLESSNVITTATSFYGRKSPMFYHKGKYFACTTASGSSLSVFLPDGTLETTISTTNVPLPAASTGLTNLIASYIPQTDRIVLTHTETNVSKYVYFIDDNYNLSAAFTKTDTLDSLYVVATEDDILPYTLVCKTGGTNEGYFYIYLAMWSPYLATINNLSSAVTKSNTHTMKIVYSIYDN